MPGRPMVPAPRFTLTVSAPFAGDAIPCPRCSEAMPADRSGECFKCESHDRTERVRIARERAIAAYGEGRC